MEERWREREEEGRQWWAVPSNEVSIASSALLLHSLLTGGNGAECVADVQGLCRESQHGRPSHRIITHREGQSWSECRAQSQWALSSAVERCWTLKREPPKHSRSHSRTEDRGGQSVCGGEVRRWGVVGGQLALVLAV